MPTCPFIVEKYKPIYRPFAKNSKYNQPSIYSLMHTRGYELFHEIEIGDEKITNYTKYVQDYLTQWSKEKGEHRSTWTVNGKTVTEGEPTDYIYVWYVRYPKLLLEEKTLIIFRKKYMLNKIIDNKIETIEDL